MGAESPARYIRLNVTSIYSTTTTSNRVGLAKVQFIDDTVPPTVILATRNFSANQVTVQFSESVLPSTAINIANYAIQSGGTTATIQSATMGTYNDTVVLQTSLLDTNLTYTITSQNVRDAANIISIASTNLTIGSELVAWLQADNGVTADGNNLVSQWNDQSGNANNAVNATNATQPTLSSGVINGLLRRALRRHISAPRNPIQFHPRGQSRFHFLHSDERRQRGPGRCAGPRQSLLHQRPRAL